MNSKRFVCAGYGKICGDIQLVGDLESGTCDILVKDMNQSRHNGTWKCETSMVDIYSDTVNVTVSDHANGLACKFLLFKLMVTSGLLSYERYVITTNSVL